MKPMGYVILIVILAFLVFECYTLVKAIKDRIKKKGVKKDGSNSDDRKSNSSSGD